MSKPIHIDWYPKDALDGMNQLTPLEELAYRRILDMIYASDDHLLDDIESMKWSTKTGTKWPKIKSRLLLLNKIEVIAGRISNAHCRRKLEEARDRIASASHAGNVSAERRKHRKNNNTASTGVGTSVGTERPTERQPTTNHQSPVSSEAKASSDNTPPDGVSAEAWEEFLSVRKSLKAKNTDYAIRLVHTELQKLKEQGFSPHAVVEQSIRNSWKDVFPLKDKTYAKRDANGHNGVHTTSGKPTWTSEGQRLAAKYREDAEREEQGAAGGSAEPGVCVAETVRENPS